MKPDLPPTGPGVQATQAGPGVQATQAGPGVQATQAGPGVQATQADPGVQATQAGPGVQATQAGPGVQATRAGPGVRAPQAGPRVRATQAGFVARWADSGAMALTGRSDGPPLGPPARLVAGLDALAAPFPALDALALLGERAAIAGLHRQGRVSCGGSCRILRAADGWLAGSPPRPRGGDAAAAWLGVPRPGPPAPPQGARDPP